MPMDTICMALSPTIQRQFSRLKDQGGFKNDQDLMQAALKALDDVLDRNLNRQVPPPPIDTRDSLEPYILFANRSPDDYDI